MIDIEYQCNIYFKFLFSKLSSLLKYLHAASIAIINEGIGIFYLIYSTRVSRTYSVNYITGIS
jgi:hypothetical protein